MIDVTLNRERGIGGSDTYKILNGDWYNLWLQKTLRAEPDNLSKQINVQVGNLTEPLNHKLLADELNIEFEWNGKGLRTEHPLPLSTYYGGIAYAHYDDYIPQLDCLVEYKHTHNFNTLDKVKDTYMGQLQHYMYVANKDSIYLSVLFGNNKHQYCMVNRDEDFMSDLLGYEQAFWNYVAHDKSPEIIGLKDFLNVKEIVTS